MKKKLWNKNRLYETFFMEPYDGFDKLRNGEFALYCERAVAISMMRKFFELHEICDTKTIDFRKNELSGLVVKKYFPLRERLTINWLRIKEVGIVQRISNYWIGKFPSCKMVEHYESVRFEYVAPVYLFLIISYILSIFVLTYELVMEKNKQNNKIVTNNVVTIK